MASHNSPSQFAFKFNENLKKSYENCFPGLTLPSSQNLLEEVGLHKQLSKTLDDFKVKNIGENSLLSKNGEPSNLKITTDPNVTPKSQKQKPPDVKRWASVVKAQKNLSTELEFNDKQPSEDKEITSDIFDCIFKTFPESFESHKSFFVISDKMFYCNICSLYLDSVLSLSNHLKTRKHEDNAIEFFKTKMPAHLHYIMEFVSFDGSNLCCNLCGCKIPMSSQNPHETIVNIMAHNSDESHISKRANRETYNSAETIFESLSQSSPIIMENMHIIERNMVPEFKCQLCKVIIMYDDSNDVLTKNFITHLKSVGHIKNQKAVEVLKLFGEASISGKDNWAVVNGNIVCTYCNREFETNLQQLISHANDVEHATNVLSKLGITSTFNKVSENNTLHENLMNEAKSLALNKPKKQEEDDKKTVEPFSSIQSKPGSRLKELLNTMPPGLNDVDYVIENENGSITCLVCNRVVPPSTYNLRTHLLGNKHKINLELKDEVPSEELSKSVPATSNKIPNSAATVKDINISRAPTTLPRNQPRVKGQNNAGQNNTKEVMSKILKQYGNILKSERGSVTCLVCQCKLPQNTSITEHISSEEHKKTEGLWLKNCPGCTSKNPFTFRVLKALPTNIRTYKCRQMETIPASVLNHLYSLLLKENQLIKENEQILVKNVDGKNSYCKLCKILIPLSLDMNTLESNIVSHLKEKRHEVSLNKSTQDESSSPKVARSLFDVPAECKKAKNDSKVFNFEEFTRLIFKDADVKGGEEKNKSFTEKVFGGESVHVFGGKTDPDLGSQKKTENESLETEHNGRSTEKSDEVFVFGKEANDALENPKDGKGSTNQNEALPVVPVSMNSSMEEEETSAEVLSRRQKQIDYGKNTEGYARYCRLVPRYRRKFYHPVTPPKHLRCSRRQWDGMIKAWRRQLHSWDPPSSTLAADIRPLV